jgi:hypothetical protein
MTDPSAPDPDVDSARFRRNRLLGRLLLVALGFLLLAQMIPFVLRA